METNSICSRSHIKNESLIKAELNNNIGNIEESILIEEKKQEPKDEFGISSYFGFGKRIMNKFVGQIERPYSPPIGEKDMT